jgi:hypothetical protein
LLNIKMKEFYIVLKIDFHNVKSMPPNQTFKDKQLVKLFGLKDCLTQERNI